MLSAQPPQPDLARGTIDFLLNRDETGRTMILLAHGSGAAMDTPWMDTVAEGLEAQGFRAARFEFSYMSARRTSGSKRPPAKADTYAPEFLAAIYALGCDDPLIIGGKSMGGDGVPPNGVRASTFGKARA